MINNTGKIKSKLKSGLPKDWLADLRTLYRIMQETFKGISRTGWVNIVIVSTMAVALTVFGVLLRASMSLSTLTEAMGNSLELSVYLKDSVDVQGAISDIKQIPHVREISLTTKEQAWDAMKMQFEVADIENPLPNTLHVKVDEPKNIQTLSNTINKMEIVESINYAKDIAKKIQVIVNVVHTMICIVWCVSALFTITIINNTIHLVIQSRKEEIEIMRLMGVSNWYIKTPLILQGAIYGFAGTVIAILPLNAFQNTLLNVHKFFVIPSPELALNFVIFIMFIMAIGFGAVGSFLSIKKYLSV